MPHFISISKRQPPLTLIAMTPRQNVVLYITFSQFIRIICIPELWSAMGQDLQESFVLTMFNVNDLEFPSKPSILFRSFLLLLLLNAPNPVAQVLPELHRLLLFGRSSHCQAGLLLGWLGQPGAESQLPRARGLSHVPRLHETWWFYMENAHGDGKHQAILSSGFRVV